MEVQLISKTRDGKPMGKTTYVVLHDYSDSFNYDEKAKDRYHKSRLLDRYRTERDNSDDKNDIPLFELAKKKKYSNVR